MNFELEKKRALVLLISSLLVLFSATIALAQQDSEGQPVVTVNDIQIDKTQLDKQVSGTMGYQTMMLLYKNQKGQLLSFLQSKESQGLLRLYLLNKLMVDELKNQKIEELGLSVKEEEIESQIDQIIENNEKISGRENLKKQLQKQRMSMEQFKNTIKNRILQKKLVDNVTPDIKVTEEEKKNYYEENKKSFQDDEGNPKPLEEVSGEIQGIITQNKKNEKYQKWLEETKQKAQVDFSESFLKNVRKKLPGIEISEISFLSWTG